MSGGAVMLRPSPLPSPCEGEGVRQDLLVSLFSFPLVPWERESERESESEAARS